MNELQELQQEGIKKRPELKPGQTVKVHQKIEEGGKTRVQAFEGLVIKINSGTGVDKTFTVRKVVEGIGVEKMFPLYSPTIEKIEVKKEGKVRRAKLYYMRNRAGKSARLKESFVKDQGVEEEEVEKSIEELAEQKEKEDAKKKEEEGVTPEEGEAEEEVKEETAEEAPAEEAPKEEEKPAEEPKPEEEAKKE